MFRRRMFLWLLLLATTFGGIKTVSASPDCSRWITQYKQKLETDRQIQRLIRTKRRLQSKLNPKPKQPVKPPVTNVASRRLPRRPRLTPEEALRRFNVECGDLPEEVQDGPLLPFDPTPTLMLARNSFIPPADATPPSDVPPPTPPASVISVPGVPITPLLPGPPLNPPGPPINPPTAPPVPEPSSIVLVTSGIAGLMEMVRRQRRAVK